MRPPELPPAPATPLRQFISHIPAHPSPADALDLRLACRYASPSILRGADALANLP